MAIFHAAVGEAAWLTKQQDPGQTGKEEGHLSAGQETEATGNCRGEVHMEQ